MTEWQIIILATTVFAGCVLQGAVGFGSGLLTVPILIWSGISLPGAVMAALLMSLVQSLWSSLRYRSHVPWREVLILTGYRSLTLPVGLWLMVVLVGLGTAQVKAAVGAVVLLALGLQWGCRVKPRASVHWGWGVLAGAASGILAGMVGMGGPPIVLWVIAHDWPNRRMRTFLWMSFFTTMPLAIGLLLWKFGSDATATAIPALCCAPLVVLGAELGMYLSASMSRHRLRIAASIVLLLIALGSIVQAVI